MTSSMRHLVPPALVTCLLAVPGAGAQARPAQAPAAPASTAPASTPPPAAVRTERFVDKVWVVDSSTSVAPGSLYVFLSDNVFVVSARDGAPVVGTWAEGADGLVISEKGRSARVDVLELTPERFRIRVDTPRTPTEVTLVPAVKPPAAGPAAATTAQALAPVAAPVAAPPGAAYRCGADTIRVAFEGAKAYLTWPDDTVVVLNEVKVADALPSRRTFSDGQLRVVEDTSEAYTRVLFARAGFRPRPCTPMR